LVFVVSNSRSHNSTRSMLTLAQPSRYLLTWLTSNPLTTHSTLSPKDRPSAAHTLSSTDFMSSDLDIVMSSRDTSQPSGILVSTGYLSTTLPSITILTVRCVRTLAVHCMRFPSIPLPVYVRIILSLPTLWKAALMSIRCTPAIWRLSRQRVLCGP
jgi:hypothetical protein